jgi:PhzF family phenazine biosynthesis protein
VSTPLYVVDAFSGVPFAGNPAGVCILEGPVAAGWMGAVAAEVNLSETAFCWPEAGGWRLRWFTPSVEVDLCGHATLAASCVLWQEGRAPVGTPIVFHTNSGDLTAVPVDSRIELDFPAQVATPLDTARAADLAGALGVDLVGSAASDKQILAEVRTPDEVVAARPDMSAVRRLGGVGVILTAADGGDGADYVLRYFAPNAGVVEDPVTGSAQCLAGPYWAARTGRHQLVARQVSTRGGTLYVGVSEERVAVAGGAVVVFSGVIRDVAVS